VILLLTPVEVLRTPTDILPDINIPVISLLWDYTGLAPQEMEQRITGNSERDITTLVNDTASPSSKSIFSPPSTFRPPWRRLPPLCRPFCARCRQGPRRLHDARHPDGPGQRYPQRAGTL
jgi:hypothetical protein